jgi:hypothetical protein
MSVIGGVEPITKLQVSPSGDDSNDLSFPTRVIYVSTAGDVKLTTTQDLTYTVPLGVGTHIIEVKRLWSTGTTATIGYLGV